MTNDKKTERPESIRDELTERGREVWLAGLGALAAVEEEGTKLYSRLVERGQKFENERRAELKEASEKAREKRDEAIAELEEASEETRSALTGAVNSALERFGVPTRNEVDRLAGKVDALSSQVEELANSLTEQKESASGSGKK